MKDSLISGRALPETEQRDTGETSEDGSPPDGGRRRRQLSNTTGAENRRRQRQRRNDMAAGGSSPAVPSPAGTGTNTGLSGNELAANRRMEGLKHFASYEGDDPRLLERKDKANRLMEESIFDNL